jgi:predicted transglutaminase-like cysteine proteinase
MLMSLLADPIRMIDERPEKAKACGHTQAACLVAAAQAGKKSPQASWMAAPGHGRAGNGRLPQWGWKRGVIPVLLLAAALGTPPPGAIQFCVRNPSFCVAHQEVSAQASDMALLERINLLVNEGIQPDRLDTADGRREENRNWRVVAPGGVGGCVEYAQTKLLLLAWGGVPLNAMRLAQVHRNGDPADEAHAVLLVRINNVPVVLDNLTPAIRPAVLTGYEWLAVQDGWQWTKPQQAPR